jgi:low temperature requirement protein LtrA
VCFCTAFGVAKVDKYLVADQSLVDFAAYFFAWWYAWILGSEYASRYNNVDFTHNLFWMVYGGGVALMLEHTGGVSQ